MSYFSDVVRFHDKVTQPIKPDKPRLLPLLEMSQRVKFMNEELDELADAYINNDMVKVADALADLVYVALGTADLCSLPFDPIWSAVHKANMSKLPGMTKRGMTHDAIKPPGWRGPEGAIELAIASASQS